MSSFLRKYPQIPKIGIKTILYVDMIHVEFVVDFVDDLFDVVQIHTKLVF